MADQQVSTPTTPPNGCVGFVVIYESTSCYTTRAATQTEAVGVDGRQRTEPEHSAAVP